jgi:glycerophosphoryl diester phosphodiesterase
VTVWAAVTRPQQAPLVVGHRGGRGEGWPAENTMGAFAQARSQGARAVELDVRTCAGGGVVVFHDESLERMTAGRDTRLVSAVPLAELLRVDVGGGARIPELAEVLAWARAEGVAVNVEMKHEVPSRLTLARETVRIVRSAGADVILSSFDPLLLAMGGAFGPEIPRALLTHSKQARWADILQEAAWPPAVQALHIERIQATAGASRYVRRGLRLGVWTVNDASEAEGLARLGALSIITDRPGALIAALTRSGPA